MIIDLATISREHFFFFVNKCNDIYRSGHDLSLYREIIAMHREYKSIEKLIESDKFIPTLYRTLEEWDMNKRAAKMTSFNNFKKSIEFWKDSLMRLYKYNLHDDIASELHNINGTLEKIFCNMKVMESKRKIVGVSKTLHFLLPDLLMPMDSKYTMTAFYGYNKYSSEAKDEFKVFQDIFEQSYKITKRLDLTPEDADGTLWKTCIPKLIDNAIIGLLNCDKEEVLSLFKTA
jgi:hypothetical protein